jgi:hypothetical protein
LCTFLLLEIVITPGEMHVQYSVMYLKTLLQGLFLLKGKVSCSLDTARCTNVMRLTLAQSPARNSQGFIRKGKKVREKGNREV